MTKDTRPQARRGVNIVADIVESQMRCGWQEFAPENDNGVDGIILDRVRTQDTGSIYFVQVKCGDGYKVTTDKRPTTFGINVGEKYIDTHRVRWNKLSGPTILIYVDFNSSKSWWTDLKSEDSYCQANKNIILVPNRQRFALHSIGDLRRLRGYNLIDRNLETTVATKENLVINRLSAKPKELAREYYKSWSNSHISERTHPLLGEIKVNRVGWRHITQRRRGISNILHSLSLLGIAKGMILAEDKKGSNV